MIDDPDDDDPEQDSGSADIGDMAGLVARGAAIGQALELHPDILNHLYAHSRFQSVGREEWERELRLATGLDRSLHRVVGRISVGKFCPVDDAPKQAAMEYLRSPSGTMLLVYHGGFAALARALFADWFPDGVRISAKGDYKAKAGAFALFAARRALLDGKTVLISPEGRVGEARLKVPVVGAECSVADGAPFLAHDTKCRTVWFGLARDGERMVPQLVEGPRASSGEPFAAYRERFGEFYGGQIEAILTGEPRNLSLSRNWVRLFERALTGVTLKEQRAKIRQQRKST